MKFAFIFLLLGITEIHAQNIGDMFGGISYIQTSIKDESSTNLGTFKPTVVGVGLSYVLMDNMALDTSLFDGVSDSSITRTGIGTVTVKIKNGYSLGVRPFIAFNESWGGYAKLGRQYGTQTKIVKRSVFEITTDSTYARTVYGLGISYTINPKWGISSEYMWSKKGDSETNKNSSVGVGLRYKF
jgi:opacity protein-like surface antigen